MSIQVVKFNTQDKPEFFKVLRERVNKHFKDNNISKHANFNMKFKTAFMVSLYFIPLFILLSGVITSFWPMMLIWLLMGLGMSGIGLAVMHDANHGSYSSNKRVNYALGFLLNLIGSYHINWKIQHNVLHHSFTNIDGFDEDIDNTNVLRLSPHQKQKFFYRFQAFYVSFLYGLMTLNRLIVKDFVQLVRYNKKNLLEGQNTTLTKAVTELALYKICYTIVTLVIPIMILELPWYQIVAGFLMMHFICGLILALIFQAAHVLEETEFFETDVDFSVENNWAIHQLKTTANFANTSTFFSWFIGGLNYQVEHHLFPHICHVHYRPISKIVKATAEEFDIPYHSHTTFFDALKSHYSLLNELGTGAYDRKLEMA